MASNPTMWRIDLHVDWLKSQADAAAAAGQTRLADTLRDQIAFYQRLAERGTQHVHVYL